MRHFGEMASETARRSTLVAAEGQRQIAWEIAQTFQEVSRKMAQAADLKKVAERFEPKTEQYDELVATSRPEASTPKAEPKHAASPAQAEHPAVGNAQSNKGGEGRKGSRRPGQRVRIGTDA